MSRSWPYILFGTLALAGLWGAASAARPVAASPPAYWIELGIRVPIGSGGESWRGFIHVRPHRGSEIRPQHGGGVGVPEHLGRPAEGH